MVLLLTTYHKFSYWMKLGLTRINNNAMATMTYIGESNVYELHPGDEKGFNDFAYEN